jgi:hypothetical protein
MIESTERLESGTTLWCYGAIDSVVHITDTSIQWQKNNPFPNSSLFVEHDGELKCVSRRLLYRNNTHVPEEIIIEEEQNLIREDLEREDLL